MVRTLDMLFGFIFRTLVENQIEIYPIENKVMIVDNLLRNLYIYICRYHVNICKNSFVTIYNKAP